MSSDSILSAVKATREGRGYLRDLVRGIEADGFKVAVPCPLDHMEQIFEHWGFTKVVKTNELGDPVDVWRRPVRPAQLIEVTT